MICMRTWHAKYTKTCAYDCKTETRAARPSHTKRKPALLYYAITHTPPPPSTNHHSPFFFMCRRLTQVVDEDVYQRQGENIITWCEAPPLIGAANGAGAGAGGTGVDLALSFQVRLKKSRQVNLLRAPYTHLGRRFLIGNGRGGKGVILLRCLSLRVADEARVCGGQRARGDEKGERPGAALLLFLL